jgi:diguanylate cyclase (GGDEF)-like protein/PAS domain S-box-containing protein
VSTTDGVEGRPPLDGAAIQAQFDSLLELHPTALVAAIGADGIFVPMPESVDLRGHQLLPGRSAMDFVAADDWDAVIEAWERARDTGSGQADVGLVTARDQRAEMHYFDACQRHGVYIGVLLGPGIEAALSEVESFVDAPPRVARAIKNDAAIFLEVDDATLQILGWSAEDLIGHRSLEFIHPDDEELAIRSWMAMLAGGDVGPRVQMRHHHRDGSWVWLEVTNYNFLDDPARGHVATEMIDVSEEVAAHEAVRRRERLFRRLAEALPTGLVHIDRDRHVVYANERLGELLGTGPAELVDERLATVVRDDWPVLDGAITRALSDGTDDDLEVQIQPSNRSGMRRCFAKIRALTDDGEVNGAIISIEDITESAQLQVELERRANIDMLTRCLNRATVMAALEATLSQPDDGFTAVIFADLDNFKTVNDRWGHAVGDELLIVAAERLTGAVRHGDFVGRLGGDEFLVVCPDVSGPHEASNVAERVAGALHGNFTIGGTAIELRASVGMECAERHGASAEDLVSRADVAMYATKRGRERRHTTQATAEDAAVIGASRPVRD